ncbi:MAG: hypothetical protein R3236_07335 [Phycisphaeraceae bacterium]|nr:hypothetical protein [Phycisphaeraceae bacterium]
MKPLLLLAAESTEKTASASDAQLLPGLGLPADVVPILSWALLVLAILGGLMLLWMPLILLGIKAANKRTDASIKEMNEAIKKVAEWSEYTGSQVEEAVKQIERLNKTMEDHAAAGRKRTQAQAAQAVQLGKLLQQQIEAIEGSG